jgi:hypothetical protein
MALHRSFDLPLRRFGRRHFLAETLAAGAALACVPQMFAAEFWNSKDPSAWTDEEVQALTTKSPWARAAVANSKHPDDPILETTGAPAGGRGGGPRRALDLIIVRWESAQPILDALRAPLPSEFAGHYVLSVTNLPLGRAPRGGRGGETAEDLLEGLQAGAALQVKGKETAGAGIARRNHIGGFLFGFPRDYPRLSPDDRDIVFRLDTGELTITAKFDGKAMMYHGKLAV